MRYTTLIAAVCAVTMARSQSLSTDLQSIATTNGLVGMSVVSICGGQVTDVVHTGKSDLTRNLFVDDSTQYRIASISKLVTAIGLMRLYEQGAFGLDDDVSTALGFLLRNPNHPSIPITYRMLLGHSSSVQDGSGYSGFISATYGSAPPPPISDLLTTTGPSYTPNMFRTEMPGTYFTYANINYGIIGTLIEALSGQRFDQYMRTQVLLPLGISGSYNVQDLPDIDLLAVLYRDNLPQADNFQGVMPVPPNLSGYVIGTNGIFFAPQGGLRVSALELARIAMLLLANGTYGGTTLLQPSTVQLMLAQHWLYNGSNGNDYYGLFKSWGLGAHRITAQAGQDVVFPGTPMFGHAGEAYGLISDLYIDTTAGYGLVFMTNGYGPGYDYQFAANSSFYSVEAEVYDALQQHAYTACLSTSVPESAELPVRLHGRTLEWNGTAPLLVGVFDPVGREIGSMVLRSGERQHFPEADHVRLIRCCSGEQCICLRMP